MDFNKFLWREWETCKRNTKVKKDNIYLEDMQISLNKSNDILNLSVVFSSTMTKNLIFMLFLDIHVHTHILHVLAEYCLFSLCYRLNKKFLPCTLT